MSHHSSSFKLMAAAAVVAGLAAAPASAQSGVDFFNGKTINYIVATDPGGGYDTYGRLIAEYLQKYLPGSTVVVRNMPGAGHIIATNYIYASEPDGLTFGTFNTGLIYNQMAGTEGVRFDLGEMSWIGKAASDPRVIVVSEASGIKDYEQLAASTVPTKFGATGVGSSDYVDIVMLKTAMNLPVDIISGYGGNETQLAMLRGEVAGAVASRSSYEPFITDGKGRFVAQIGGTQTDIPQLASFVTTDTGKQVLDLMTAQSNIARLTAGPPGIPEDRLNALRDAYRQALSDPELLERAQKMRLPIDPLIGDELVPVIKAQFNQAPETIDLIKQLLAK